jgi:hypothetical protein
MLAEGAAAALRLSRIEARGFIFGAAARQLGLASCRAQAR